MEVLDFPRDRIWRCIGTVAAPPSVVVEDRKASCQSLGDRGIDGSITRGTSHQDDRRTLADLIECDHRAVFGLDLHVSVPVDVISAAHLRTSQAIVGTLAGVGLLQNCPLAVPANGCI